MTTKIENETDFIKAIDAFGDLISEIDKKKREMSIDKQVLELYANEHKITRQNGERYRLVMKKGSPALRCQPDVSDADVVALLKRTNLGAKYVVPTYDSVALKHDFGGSDDGREHLAEFGLMLTEPRRHAEVKELREK